jgi:hypothetical protein
MFHKKLSGEKSGGRRKGTLMLRISQFSWLTSGYQVGIRSLKLELERGVYHWFSQAKPRQAKPGQGKPRQAKPPLTHHYTQDRLLDFFF